MRAGWLSLVCLAACAPAVAPPGAGGAVSVREATAGREAAPPRIDPLACRPERYAVLIGQVYSPAVRARLPGQRVRVIRPGQAVTKDYWPDRLNVALDAEGRIEQLFCG